jgi:hypothetical protein
LRTMANAVHAYQTTLTKIAAAIKDRSIEREEFFSEIAIAQAQEFEKLANRQIE